MHRSGATKALSLCRMKNTVTYLFIVFLATLIIYGGAGVNLITYAKCTNIAVAMR